MREKRGFFVTISTSTFHSSWRMVVFVFTWIIIYVITSIAWPLILHFANGEKM